MALFATVAFGIAPPGFVHADRVCLGDPLITGRTCPEEVCLALQATVILRCKDEQLFSCRKLSNCEALREMRQRWADCGLARDRINSVCWGGGDPGHQQQSTQAWQNVANCDARIAEKCDDPCPQIPGKSSETHVTSAEASAGTSVTQTEEAAIGLALSLLERLAAEGDPEALRMIEGEFEPRESECAENEGQEK